MKIIKVLIFLIVSWISLASFSSIANENTSENEVFTAYILDTDGQFIAQLKHSIALMKPKEDGRIDLVLESRVDKREYYRIFRPYYANKSRADIDSDEEYQLIVFKSDSYETAEESVLFSEHQKSWFGIMPEVSIQKKKVPVVMNGMVNMVNLENARSDVPHQFMELLGGVARQAAIVRKLNHPNVIKLAYDPAQTDNIPVLELTGENFQDYLESHKTTMGKLLSDLVSLSTALKHVHDRSIAHGDIRLGHVYRKHSDVILANFERSSDVSVTSGANKLGRKKFTFYNNDYHAPEVRYPQGFGEKWKYTHATLEGDIWSFGMLLAEALYLNPVSHEMALSSRVGQPLWRLFQVDASSMLGNISMVDKQWDQVPLTHYFRHLKADVPAFDVPAPGQLKVEVLDGLKQLINDCTRQDPKARPNAGHVEKRLRAIHRLI